MKMENYWKKVTRAAKQGMHLVQTVASEVRAAAAEGSVFGDDVQLEATSIHRSSPRPNTTDVECIYQLVCTAIGEIHDEGRLHMLYC